MSICYVKGWRQKKPLQETGEKERERKKEREREREREKLS